MLSKIDFSSLISNLPVGICRSQAVGKGKLIYANEIFYDLLGLENKAAAQTDIADLFSDSRVWKSLQKKIINKKNVRNLEAKLKHPIGKIVWCSLSAQGGSGKINGKKCKYIDLVLIDISVQKKADNEIKESRKLFRTIFDNSAVAITVTDKEERLIAWNPFAERLLGMNKIQLFNKPVRELYPAAEWKRLRSMRIRQRGLLTNIETKIIRDNGDVVDVDMSLSMIKDQNGQTTGAIGIIRDISRQKQTERRLKESENKIRIILDNSPASITFTDAQEKIVLWNKFTEEMFGMKNKDLMMRPVRDLYPSEEWQKIRGAQIRKSGSKHHLETKIVTKAGRLIDVDLSVNMLQDLTGNTIGSVGIMQDITKQKHVLEMLIQAKLSAEQANSAKSLFLASMSHEVRTPMNTIMGMIDLTMDTEMTAEQRENLQVIKEASDNLLGLINDILDLSRVEAGKIALENIEFHLPNIARSVVKGLSVLAAKKKLALEIDIAGDVPELLEGDPVRVRQILINLINNAIKFTPKGKIRTEIKLGTPVNSDETVIQFAVIDEGIGIAKEKQEAIFDAFSQADASINRKFGGTGLGLAICKRLVEMMGGRMWVESEEGKGSIFYFTAIFKMIKQSAENGIAKPEISTVAVDEIKDLRILLAEDNIVNQKIAQRMLEKQGWNVKAVENGQAVIDLLEKEPFDLILMDALMPVLDGMEATILIRENERQTGKHIPIIALTARAMEDDRRKCLEAGMDGYVAKPIDRKKLFEEIANTITKGQQDEQR